MQLQFCVVLPFCVIGPQFWPSVQLLLLFYSTVWFYPPFSDTRHAVVARSDVLCFRFIKSPKYDTEVPIFRLQPCVLTVL